MRPTTLIITLVVLFYRTSPSLSSTVVVSDETEKNEGSDDKPTATTAHKSNEPNEETGAQSFSKLDYHTRIHQQQDQQPSTSGNKRSIVDPPNSLRKGTTSRLSITSRLGDVKKNIGKHTHTLKDRADNLKLKDRLSSLMEKTSTLSKDTRDHLGDTKKNLGKIKNASLHILKDRAGNLKERQSSLMEKTSTLSKDMMEKTSTLSKDMKYHLGDKKKQFHKILHIVKERRSILRDKLPSREKFTELSDSLRERQTTLRGKLHLDLASDTLRDLSNVALHNLGEMGERSHSTLYGLFTRPNEESAVILAVLAICLLGTSIGFRSYLYFVSVGQSLCIGLVSLVSLIACNLLSKHPIPTLTTVQSSLTLLWSVRLTYFLLHREHVDWPGQHQQLLAVERRSRTKAKFSVWWTCATFYAAMVMPCVYRLRAAFVNSPKGTEWGTLGRIGIGMQCFGLGLETVADYQKGAFKVREGNRNRWCEEGVWRFSTHPNYLGEITFWVGVYLGGVGCFANLLQWTVCTTGLLFSVIVMKSAIDSLDLKQFRRYGYEEDFRVYRQTHSIFGPTNIFPRSKQSIMH